MGCDGWGVVDGGWVGVVGVWWMVVGWLGHTACTPATTRVNQLQPTTTVHLSTPGQASKPLTPHMDGGWWWPCRWPCR